MRFYRSLETLVYSRPRFVAKPSTEFQIRGPSAVNNKFSPRSASWCLSWHVVCNREITSQSVDKCRRPADLQSSVMHILYEHGYAIKIPLQR